VPTRRSPARLADYAGTYQNRGLGHGGIWLETVLSVRGVDGGLRGQVGQVGAESEIGQVFYRGENGTLLRKQLNSRRKSCPLHQRVPSTASQEAICEGSRAMPTSTAPRCDPRRS
jgi:hypothetical protein